MTFVTKKIFESWFLQSYVLCFGKIFSELLQSSSCKSLFLDILDAFINNNMFKTKTVV